MDLEVQASKNINNLPYNRCENKINLYTIKDIQDIMGIGQNCAYKLVKIKGFPKIQIGKKILVPEDEFNNWIKNNIGNEIRI